MQRDRVPITASVDIGLTVIDCLDWRSGKYTAKTAPEVESTGTETPPRLTEDINFRYRGWNQKRGWDLNPTHFLCLTG